MLRCYKMMLRCYPSTLVRNGTTLQYYVTYLYRPLHYSLLITQHNTMNNFSSDKHATILKACSPAVAVRQCTHLQHAAQSPMQPSVVNLAHLTRMRDGRYCVWLLLKILSLKNRYPEGRLVEREGLNFPLGLGCSRGSSFSIFPPFYSQNTIWAKSFRRPNGKFSQALSFQRAALSQW